MKGCPRFIIMVGVEFELVKRIIEGRFATQWFGPFSLHLLHRGGFLLRVVA
jgi:hypothetical protein